MSCPFGGIFVGTILCLTAPAHADSTAKPGFVSIDDDTFELCAKTVESKIIECRKPDLDLIKATKICRKYIPTVYSVEYGSVWIDPCAAVSEKLGQWTRKNGPELEFIADPEKKERERLRKEKEARDLEFVKGVAEGKHD